MAGPLPLEIQENSPFHLSLRLLRAGLVVIVIFALPYLVPAFRLSQITSACILAAAVVGLNMLSGWGGQISLGHAAFFGLGAYTTGILMTKESLSAPEAMLIGIVVCFVVGVIVGMPALRLQGTYLAVVTLAVGVIFPSLVRRFASLTGGSAGLFGLQYNPPSGIGYFSGPNGRTIWMYWVSIVVLMLSCLVVWNLMRSRTGRAIIALRDNEAAAIVMGVNRTIVRTLLFGLSSGIAGLAGGVYAVNTGIITPDSFSLLLTIYFLVAMVLGGSASYWGPIFGGFAIYFVPVWTSDLANGPIAGLFFGTVIILMVFTMRSGLVGLISRLARLVLVVSMRPPKGVADRSARAITRSDGDMNPQRGSAFVAEPDMAGPSLGDLEAQASGVPPDPGIRPAIQGQNLP
jgi:branched-chain amino acid transport system permease protein